MAMKKVYYTMNGQLIGEKAVGGSRVDYLTDALGNVTATVNQSAQVVNTYRYKPFGGLLAKTGIGSDPAFQWVGVQGYRQTGKSYADVYIRARHYSSALGHWTTVDPIRLKSGEWNWYLYAKATPTVGVDPTGLQIPPCESLILQVTYFDLALKEAEKYRKRYEWYRVQTPFEPIYVGGVTCCDPRANNGPKYWIFLDMGCAQPLIAAHEEEHLPQQNACCRKLQKWYKKDKPNQQQYCGAYIEWMNWNTRRFECAAWDVTDTLQRTFWKGYSCDQPGPPPGPKPSPDRQDWWRCCNALKEWRTKIDQAMGWYRCHDLRNPLPRYLQCPLK